MIKGKEVKWRSCVRGRAVQQRSVNLWKGGAVKKLNVQRRLYDYREEKLRSDGRMCNKGIMFKGEGCAVEEIKSEGRR